MTPTGMVTIEVDQRQLARAVKRLEQYQGKPLQRRAQQAVIEGARLLRGPMQSAAPVKSGALRASITTRHNRLRLDEMAVATTGTRFRKAPHRHLVTAGTKPHSLAVKRPGKSPWSRMPDGRWMPNALLSHPGSRANPFVARVSDALTPRVQDFIATHTLDIGGLSFG